MKIRNGFVTNSSSSSFIIAKKDVDEHTLVHKVLKDLYVELSLPYSDDESREEIEARYNPMDVLNGDSMINLQISTRNKYDDYEDGYLYPRTYNDKDDEEIYVIDNGDYGRYDFGIVEEVIREKHNLNWEYGYCD